jgi:hypothetical protein
METELVVIGLAWLAILAMLAAGWVLECWRRLRPAQRAPFFVRLERRGVSLVQAEHLAGFAGLRDAAALCGSCRAAAACRRALRWRRLGFQPPACPNAAFFARAGGAGFP